MNTSHSVLSPQSSALLMAYLSIPEFEVQLERLRRGGAAGVPVVLGGAAHDRAPARRVSKEAEEEGVREGMPLREAAARCPTAVFLPYDEPAYKQAFGQVLGALQRYGDAVEPDGYGCAWVDSSGWGGLRARLELARELVRDPALGPYSASIGLAPTKFTARLAALTAPVGEAVAVPAWMEPVFLEDFPVGALQAAGLLGEKNLRRLRRLGVRTLGQFVALPAAETKLQFGSEGVLARRAAEGSDRRPVIPPREARELVAHWSFEPPVEDLDTIHKTTEHLLGELRGRLGVRVASAVEMRLGLSTGERLQARSHLPEPSGALRDLLLGAVRALDRLPIQAGVERLEVRLPELAPEEGRQTSLWDLGRHLELARALDRLRDQFGPGRLRRAVSLEPGSPLPRKQFALVERT